MKNFTRFIKDKKRARLDIHCINLEKKEGEELFKLLKNFGFTFCYALSDSMLAFLIGKFSSVKSVMKELEKDYGFTWTDDKLILGNKTIIRK